MLRLGGRLRAGEGRRRWRLLPKEDWWRRLVDGGRAHGCSGTRGVGIGERAEAAGEWSAVWVCRLGRLLLLCTGGRGRADLYWETEQDSHGKVETVRCERLPTQPTTVGWGISSSYRGSFIDRRAHWGPARRDEWQSMQVGSIGTARRSGYSNKVETATQRQRGVAGLLGCCYV